jgi:heptosyltransferase-2
MGDAVLASPALRAIRAHFADARISFLGSSIVRQVIERSGFEDEWITPAKDCPFVIAKELRRHHFTSAILLKNSFGSALAVFLARIPGRIGYAREGRGLFLTDRLYPAKTPCGRFKPESMVDYYLAMASYMGADTENRRLEVAVDRGAEEGLYGKLPQLKDSGKRLIVLVPGGAFGPSKCWASERFAETADRLISDYGADVVISVAPEASEKEIAADIQKASANELMSLADTPFTLGELKALCARADLVITNDTGPRHIAIALGRKVVTLFGPNDPRWTDTGYEKEVQIVGKAECGPCQKPECAMERHICMEAISVDMVVKAAKGLLERD